MTGDVSYFKIQFILKQSIKWFLDYFWISEAKNDPLTNRKMSFLSNFIKVFLKQIRLTHTLIISMLFSEKSILFRDHLSFICRSYFNCNSFFLSYSD